MTSPRLTAPQRLRLAVARILGERTMLRLARWAAPDECAVYYVSAIEGQARVWESVCDSITRKRRALARRRWERRAAKRNEWNANLDEWCRKWGQVTFSPITLYFAPVPIVQPGSTYPPSDACVLTPSGTAPRNVEE